MCVNDTAHLTFIVFPGIIVRPVAQFFIDPREQPDGTIRERITECLGLGRLLCEITLAAIAEPLRARKSFFLFRSPGCN